MDEMLVRDKIGKLAHVLYCAEASGPATLSHLQRWFQEIAQWAGAKSRPEVRLLALAVTRVLDKIILDRLFTTLTDGMDACEDLSSDTAGNGPAETNRYTQDELVDMLSYEVEELEACEELSDPSASPVSKADPGMTAEAAAVTV